jgi:hypothetical protein
MSWRDHIKIHPAADFFPTMSEQEIETLAKDIEVNTLSHPIVIWSPDHNYYELRKTKRKRFEWYLLDGRNRLAALEQLGRLDFERSGWPLIEGIFTSSDQLSITVIGPEVDPYSYVISANIRRRHLDRDQRRELVAKLLKAKPEASNLSISKQVKVDDKTVASVRREMEGRSEIPNVATVTDTRGRLQPAAKPEAPEPSRVEYVTARWKRDANGIEVAKIVLAHLKYDMPAGDVGRLREVLEDFAS